MLKLFFVNVKSSYQKKVGNGIERLRDIWERKAKREREKEKETRVSEGERKRERWIESE